MNRAIGLLRSIAFWATVALAALLLAPTGPAFAATFATPRHVVGDYVVDSHPASAASPWRAPLRAALVPASVDLRANMPPVGDQGLVGDCTEWAIGYTDIVYLANVQQRATGDVDRDVTNERAVIL